MALIQSIIGVRVYHVMFRKDYRTFFDKPDYKMPCLNSLIYIDSGKGLFEFKRARVTAGKGTLLCFESAKLVLARSDPDYPVSYYMFNFDLLDINGSRVNAGELGLPFMRTSGNLPLVRRLLGQMLKIWQARGKYALAGCSQLGLTLLQALDRMAEPRGKIREKPFLSMDARIASVVDFMRANYKRTFALEFLAKKACLHPKYFARLFKRSTGLSPHQFQLRRKIEKAKDWLTMEGEPLVSTAEELGFSDYSHFYRIFRKMTGLSPMAYCRQFNAMQGE